MYVTTIIVYRRRDKMSKKVEFHGSDLEKIEEYYGIPKEEIIQFAANVNPLGLSDSVKKELAAHLDIISSYPDRSYTSLKQVISRKCCRRQRLNRAYLPINQPALCKKSTCSGPDLLRIRTGT